MGRGRAIASSTDRDAQLTQAFRQVLCRTPHASDLALLQQMHAKQLALYQKDLKSAKALLAIGAAKFNADLDPAEHAAFTAVALALFNFDEALTRE